MNEHKAFPLFTAFSDINEKYISDALDETQHKSKWYLNSAFLGISAACFCLVTVATAAMIALGGSESAHFSAETATHRHTVIIPPQTELTKKQCSQEISSRCSMINSLSVLVRRVM